MLITSARGECAADTGIMSVESNNAECSFKWLHAMVIVQSLLLNDQIE